MTTVSGAKVSDPELAFDTEHVGEGHAEA